MAPLVLGMDRLPRHRHRKLHAEGSALAGSGAHVDLPSVFLDDAVADRKPKSGAAAGGLGGEERIKDADQVLAGDSDARIGDLDFDITIRSEERRVGKE